MVAMGAETGPAKVRKISLRQFVQPSSIEYGLIAVVIIASVKTLGAKISTDFSKIAGNL